MLERVNGVSLWGQIVRSVPCYTPELTVSYRGSSAVDQPVPGQSPGIGRTI